MASQVDSRFDPACMYGPGGDFMRIWPKCLSPTTGNVRDLIGSIFDLGKSMLGLEPQGSVPVSEQSEATEHAFAGKPVIARANKTYNSAGGSSNCLQLPRGQKLLFADDSRIVTAARDRPGYRIRSYRKAAKKRNSISVIRQESLFEAVRSHARTA